MPEAAAEETWYWSSLWLQLGDFWLCLNLPGRGGWPADAPPRCPQSLQQRPRAWVGWGVRTGSAHCGGRALLARGGPGCLGDRRVLRHLRRGTRPLEAPWPAPTPGPLSRSGKPLRSFFSSYLKSLPDVRKKLLSLPEKPNEDKNPEVVVWREFDRQVPSSLSRPARGCMHRRPCSPEPLSRWLCSDTPLPAVGEVLLSS